LSYSTIQMTPMNSPRISFGCCLSQDWSWIYVAGGLKDGRKELVKCEFYEIASNKWIQLPDLK